MRIQRPRTRSKTGLPETTSLGHSVRYSLPHSLANSFTQARRSAKQSSLSSLHHSSSLTLPTLTHLSLLQALSIPIPSSSSVLGMDKHRKPPSPPTTHTNSSLPFLLFPRVPGQDLSRGLSPLIYSPTPVSKHRRKNKETLGFPIMVRKYTSLSSPLARGENDTFIPASGPTLRNITLLEKQKMGLHVDRRDAGIDVAGRGAVLSGAETKGVDLAIGKGVDEKGASVRLYEIRPQHRNSIASYPVVWLSLSDHSHSGFYEKCKNGDSVLEKEEWYIPLTRRSPHWDPLTEHPRVEAPRNSTVKHQRDNSGVFMGSESSSGKKNGTFASTTFTSPTILQKSPIQRPHALATRASSHDAATEAEISHLLTETASLLKRITKSSLAMQTLRTEKEELIDTVTQQNAEIEENDDQISELRQERRDQDLIRAVHVLHDLETQFTGRDAESSVLVEERRGEGDVLVRLVRSLEGIGLTDEETAELVDLQTECAGLVSETVHLTETIAILGAKTQHLGASHKDLEAELEHERKCTAILEAENGKLLSEGKEREVMGKEKHNLAIQKQNLAHGCHKFESLVEALETMLKTADFEIATQKARGNGLELRLAEETKRASDLVSAGKEFSVQNAQLVHALEALIEAIEDMESSMEMLEVQNVALKVEKGELVLENSMLGEEAKRLCEQIEEAQRERRALGMLVEVVADRKSVV